MRSVLLGVVLTVGSWPAFAENVDPRALEACKKTSPTFVQIAECLPNAHVAVVMMDAFDRIYPEEAAPLRSKCLELNSHDFTPGATCVYEAVRDAVDLKRSLPKGASIDDPVFSAVSDPVKKSQLDKAREEAMKAFPEKRYWGGTTYQRYR